MYGKICALCSILLLTISDVNARPNWSSQGTSFNSTYPSSFGNFGSNFGSSFSQPSSSSLNSFGSGSNFGSSSGSGYPTTTESSFHSRYGSSRNTGTSDIDRLSDWVANPKINAPSFNAKPSFSMNWPAKSEVHTPAFSTYPSSTSRPGSISYPVSNGLSGNGAINIQPSTSFTVQPYAKNASTSSYPQAQNGLSGNSATGNVQRNSNWTSKPETYQPATNFITNTVVQSGSYPANGFNGNKASNIQFPTSSVSQTYPTINSYLNNTLNNFTKNVTSIAENVPKHVVYHQQVSAPTSAATATSYNHYSYKQPKNIHYHETQGKAVYYPAFTGSLPQYVFDYRASSNKYNSLLSGLALYNLGKISANPSLESYHKRYTPQIDEHCKFGVHYRSGQFDEMAVDCRTITYFIYEMNEQSQASINMASNMFSGLFGSLSGNNQNPLMNSDGSLRDSVNTNIQTLSSGFGAMSSQLSTNGASISINQDPSINDARFSGPTVKVNSEMECYVVKSASFTNMKKMIPCDLLQAYSEQSFSSATVFAPTLTLILMLAISFIFY